MHTHGGTQLLLSLGANVNCTDDYGRTPLHWAAYDGQVETAQVWVHAICKRIDVFTSVSMYKTCVRKALNMYVSDELEP
jgi:hypothetical protein